MSEAESGPGESVSHELPSAKTQGLDSKGKWKGRGRAESGENERGTRRRGCRSEE